MLTVSVLSAAHAASRRFRSPRTRFRASPGPPALERPAWRPGPHRALHRAALWAQDESIAPSQTHWGVCPKSPTPRPLTIQTLKVGQVVDERRERAAAPTSPEDAPPGTAATRTSRGAQDRMRMGPADDGGDGGDDQERLLRHPADAQLHREVHHHSSLIITIITIIHYSLIH